MSLQLMFDTLPNTALLRQFHLVKRRKTNPGFALLPFSPSTLWRMVKDGTFPAPIKLSGGITAWPVGDVRAWLAAQSEAGTLSTSAGPREPQAGA